MSKESAAAWRVRVLERCHLPESSVVGRTSCYGKNTGLFTKNGNVDVVGIATTDHVDSEGDVVLPGGCVPKSYFEQNGKVFMDHWTGGEDLVGWKRFIKPVEGRWDGVESRGWQVKVALIKSSPHYDMLCEVCSATTFGMSIGFIPLEMGPPSKDEAARYPGVKNVIRKWEWYELSFTPFPCNVNCQTQTVTPVESDGAKRMAEYLTTKAKSPGARRLLRLRALVVPTRLVVPLEVE